jgi:DinB family protein
MPLPSPTEYAPYYGKYVSLVPETDIVGALEAQIAEMAAILRPVPEAQSSILHSPYTWTIKEVVGHLTDTERVFGYRALRFARDDRTPLPGFDENEYARSAEFNRLPLPDLVSEFEAVRRSHVWLFRNLPEAAWARGGEANATPMTVRAIAYMLVGHTRHHAAIIRKRLAG